MNPEVYNDDGKRAKNSGHNLSKDELASAILSIRNPVMVLKGSRENTLVTVSELKDNKNREIMISVATTKNYQIEINSITSVYRRTEFAGYIKEQIEQNHVLAYNTEKADDFLNCRGVDFPKRVDIISFDNTITHSLDSVKRCEENNLQEDIMASNIEETKKQTFIEFLRSVDKDAETETDWLFDGDVIVGDVEMRHALVWEWGADISEYGYEKYKALLDSEYEITVGHGHTGYSVIEIFCDDYELGEEFFAAAAGYINSTEYDKIFIEPPAPEKEEDKNMAEITVTKKYWNELYDEFVIRLENEEVIDAVLPRGAEIISAKLVESDYDGEKKAVIEVNTGWLKAQYQTTRIYEINPFFAGNTYDEYGYTIKNRKQNMEESVNWRDKIGEKFFNRGDDGHSDAQKYKVLSVSPEDDNRVIFRRDDGWTFTAVNAVMHENGNIEWDYSLGGRFVDVQDIQKHVSELVEEKNAPTSKQEIINRLMANLKDGEPEDMIYVAESKILDIYQNMSVEQLLGILNKVEQTRDNPENSHDADAEDDEEEDEDDEEMEM
jgi:hypothetical protein